MVALGQDLGDEFKFRIWVDSSTARAIVSRLVLGKVQHMEVRYMWAQESHRAKRLEVRKSAGQHDPADVLTKALSAGDMVEKLRTSCSFCTASKHIDRLTNHSAACTVSSSPSAWTRICPTANRRSAPSS